jgi:CotH kinase protein
MRSLGLALLTASATIAALPTGAAAQSGQQTLPVVVIDAPEGIVDEPKRPATMRVTDRQGREEYSGHLGIELRGFTSQQDDPKKPYALETRKPSGENRNVSLLGMPKDDDWVLIASYRDESLLRNLVAYSAARWLGGYASRTRLVEVILNDSYEGVYLLAEELKLHKSRVAVDDSDVSGGYLLEMTSLRRTEGLQFFTTPVQSQPVVYTDPNGDDLSAGRAAWIRDYVSRFERRLYGDRFRHPRRGYRRYVDVDAAVDYLLLNELFRNADTFRNSTYMHKGTGGKLVLGPLWDFDHAVGNDGDAEDNLTTGWEYSASPWAGRLYADPAFRRLMATRWESMRRQGLKRHIMRAIDRGARQLAGAQERNFSRWPVFGTDAAKPVDPRTGAPPANHAQAVDYLEWWLVTRTKWIDRHINGLRPSTTRQEVSL